MGTTSVANVRRRSIGTSDEIPWVTTILIGMGIGGLGLLLYAISEGLWGVPNGAQQGLRVFACSLVIAVAAGIAGTFIGFIFGIPKSSATASSVTAEGTHTASAEYQGNSNLEQISDWLTKILVGAGLVQLGAIRTEFNNLGSRFGTSGPLGSSGWIVGPAVIIAYGVSGFLLAYLWARIYMAQALIAGNPAEDYDGESKKPASEKPALDGHSNVEVHADAGGASAAAGDTALAPTP